MNAILHLWLPILATAVMIFIASSLIHMVFKWHNADYRKLANEQCNTQAQDERCRKLNTRYGFALGAQKIERHAEQQRKQHRRGAVVFR